MSFVQDFTATQTLGLPNCITLTDTSTGSDGNIASRRVTLAIYNGNTLVPSGTSTSYIVWSYSGSTITLDVLDKDYGILITVDWLDVSGNVLYTKQYYRGFTLYNETYDYGLTQMMLANPILINDGNFFNNKSLFRTYVDSGNQALSLASDLINCQLCYDAATAMRLKSQYIFNINS